MSYQCNHNFHEVSGLTNDVFGRVEMEIFLTRLSVKLEMCVCKTLPPKYMPLQMRNLKRDITLVKLILFFFFFRS